MKERKPIVRWTLTYTILILTVVHAFAAGQTAAPKASRKTAAASTQRVWVVGHRGAAGLFPENTLASFKRALDLGVDAVELDVLLSADKELVVHHDFRLKLEIARTPDGSWLDRFPGPAVKDLPLAELKTYDVGRLKPYTTYAGRYPKQQPADGERIPTLREVLSLLKKRGDGETKVFVEIKTSPEEKEALAKQKGAGA